MAMNETENEIVAQEPSDVRYREQWAKEQEKRRVEMDNHQRRNYAAAALSGLIAESANSNADCVLLAWDVAVLMLAEQKRRESHS